MTDPVDFQPGSFGCHEVLHMANFFAGAVDTYLIEHPAIQANDEWFGLAEKAANALSDLYKAIGRAHFDAS